MAVTSVDSELSVGQMLHTISSHCVVGGFSVVGVVNTDMVNTFHQSVMQG